MIGFLFLPQEKTSEEPSGFTQLFAFAHLYHGLHKIPQSIY